MLRSVIRFTCCVAVLAAGTLALAQTEFSADIVNDQAAGKAATKVYFGKDKVRFDAPDNSGGGVVILDLNTQSILVLMAKQRMYMEMPSQMMESRGMFQFFKSGDVDNACADWLKVSKNQNGTCHKVGHETVNGRDTVKYEGTGANGDNGTFWLDSKLRFPVKWQGKKDGGELRNIQEGAQPASLFEIPAGYNKMDMGGLTQRPK
jgi:hypothetical protein